MNPEVYDKLADAIQVKRAEQRAQHVRDMVMAVAQVKCAERHDQYAQMAMVEKELQKQAAVKPPPTLMKVLSRWLWNARGAQSELSSTGAAMKSVGRAMSRVRAKLSPKVDTSEWSKWDPRRLFTTTRRTQTSVKNTPTPAPEGGGGSGGDGAYAYGGGGGGGSPRPYDELPAIAGQGTTTRVSPGKILAALGLGTGGAAAAIGGGKGGKGGDAASRAALRKALLIAGGAAALGLGAYGVGSMMSKRKRKKEHSAPQGFTIIQ